MKIYFLYFISIMLFLSCNNKDEEQKTENKEKERIEVSIIEEPEGEQNINSNDLYEFVSAIRPNETDISLGTQYVDNMTFVVFNDDYDYGFSLFITESGDTVTLLHNDPIDNSYKDKKMTVLWEIGTFYEAGEGEQKYFKETLISYELVDKQN